MNEELDEILLDQYHWAKKRKKIYKRIRKVMPHEKLLDYGEEAADKNAIFFASMINNKDLIKKKHKRKIKKQDDILARNPVFQWYRNIFYFSFFGYKMVMNTASQYMNFFKKVDNEKS